MHSFDSPNLMFFVWCIIFILLNSDLFRNISAAVGYWTIHNTKLNLLSCCQAKK